MNHRSPLGSVNFTPVSSLPTRSVISFLNFRFPTHVVNTNILKMITNTHYSKGHCLAFKGNNKELLLARYTSICA